MARQEITINALESRLLALAAAMRESDAHALKCFKMGLDFTAEYPDEYAAYLLARAEYNEVEERLAELQTEGAEEPERAAEDLSGQA